MSGEPTLVCLTPVKDEAWILERFLAAAATWADVIVVADQGSKDCSRDIARAHDKVVLVENRSPAYDEGARQRLLLETARQHVLGPRILIALDADEALSADAQDTEEWPRLLSAAPGTVLRFRWPNLMPPGDTAWFSSSEVPFGFVDDGSEHSGERIHSTRLPSPAGTPALSHDAIVVLHLQYLDWERMKAKQRWYQAWERRNHPEKRPIQLYRQYHRMDAPDPRDTVPAAAAWLQQYTDAGIDLTRVDPQAAYSWDGDVLRWMAEDPQAQRRVDVWDVDWDRRASALGIDIQTPADPRSAFERRVMGWLARTQARADAARTRWLQRLLRPLGW